MRALLLTLLLVLPLRAQEAWTRTDTVVESACVAALLVDWGQTLTIADKQQTFVYSDCTIKWSPYQESNPLLHHHPSRGEVNRYFALTLLTHAALVVITPPRWRHLVQGMTLGIELYCVGRNARAGIKITF